MAIQSAQIKTIASKVMTVQKDMKARSFITVEISSTKEK